MKKRSAQKKDRKEAYAELGIGSIYEQLGYKNHKEMETKSTLVMEIGSAIKAKKLTQIKAAKILGISQPKLSDLLSGHFRGYSVERLLQFLNELGKDVYILVENKPRNRRLARTRVCRSNDHGNHPCIPMVAKGG